MTAGWNDSIFQSVLGRRYFGNQAQHPRKRVALDKSFYSDEKGFEVASVIVMGEEEAALIDTQWTLSNAHRVIAEVLETGKKLKTIYLTHAHPDHYFGTGHIAEAFPDAKVIALPEDCKLINKQFFGKIEHWEQTIGAHNVCRKVAKVEPITENYFELEGHRIEIIPQVMGDMKYNSVVWIPSIKTLFGSDVLFNQAHPFTCELTAEERAQWLKDLDAWKTDRSWLSRHQKPGMPFDDSSFTFMRDYWWRPRAAAKTNDVAGFYYAMVSLSPRPTSLSATR